MTSLDIIMGDFAAKVPTLIPKKLVAAQLGICVRSVDRKVKRGELSKPLKINGRDFWPSDRADIDRQKLIDFALTRHA